MIDGKALADCMAEACDCEPEHPHRPGYCHRWGDGDDACVRHEGHCGPCESEDGETTLTILEAIR